MPTESKGMINQLSNMVAPQVSGQGKNDSIWKIVTGKKTKKQVKGLFKNEDFPPLPKSSSVTLDSKDDMDTSSNKTAKHSPTRAKLRKRMAKITRDIELIKQRNQCARTTKKCEDDKSTFHLHQKIQAKELGLNQTRTLKKLSRMPEEV